MRRVWVERVQEIEPEDVDAEGLPESDYSHVDSYRRQEFADLWNSLYDKEGLGWDANPWVWCCEFEVQP